MELSSRGIALRAALLAAAILGLVEMLNGSFGWATLAGAALSALLAAALFRDSRPLRKRLAVGGVKPASASAVSPAVLLAALPDPVVLIDRRGVVLNVNPAGRALFPLLVEARPLAFIVRAPAVLDGIETVLRGGGAVQAEFREHGSVERTLEAHIAPLLTGQGPLPEGAVLLIRDLTSARRLEHMRVDFVANASHELRTPLASLIGFIETLQGPARNDENARERFLVIMRDQARRMSRLIDDLLSLSRIEMNLHVPPSDTVEVGLLVRHMIETLAPLAQERGVTVALELAPMPVYVTGDRDELLRVVENLVENAIKYGQKGQRVDVSVTKRKAGGEEVVIEVRDYGPGVAPEHLPRLTERFYRADVAESREKGGTGLGLAIVKHIVNRHRGRLDIESRSGEGAMFRVSLPRVVPAGEDT
ncbi:two-component system phosphate regulon sensor histidine kinase PhoR [Pseudochelatococcus lubricantis]|uniref:histidine kinase n=1 Tax=Pseudochelatococcus lubricantis TaxID=1538102 RepID=A0ABX0V1G1_9HYPH|nr:ATP-binding protein [Pseudochelatococcus lubricantis]NIJ58145.1 two-component system phosphate regulon sensor histidine kinase PhoR [Pseudochelatococcus lubricantis]